ncbi:MAG: hypothetical protein HYT98_03775 [Candidatus Sungbacteria bacterium]|nr:hypothetical protein [Candidatus Sungbacteria bacterium]
MDAEAIKNEIKAALEAMGFGPDLEGIESHEGMTNRFSVRLRHSGGEFDVGKEGDDVESRDAQPRRTDGVGMLIGEQGGNLLALEHILKKILKKKLGNEIRFTLDINDYRMRRLEDLKQDVKEAAKEVRMYRKDVALRPASAFERRIIHMLLAEYPDITTESIGMEPYRRVVIKPYP